MGNVQNRSVCLFLCAAYDYFFGESSTPNVFHEEAKACKNAQRQLQKGQMFFVIFRHLNQSDFL